MTFGGLNVGPTFTDEDATQFALAAMCILKGEDDDRTKILDDAKLPYDRILHT